MTTLLNQALVLTLIGMGMTFGALGLLVLGMYAMTALITDKPRRETASTEEAPAEEALVTRVADVVLHLAAAASQPSTEVEADRPRDEDREYAAAAAVALALALEGDAPQLDATPADRYRAAAAAVAMAVACADAVPANISTIPDAWNYHARAQQFTGRGRR
jgi:Na+-transporting methylmalonyl-CoA/oxaloacetate decarboxylase gamma subunit